MGSLRPMLTEFDLLSGGFTENPAPNFSYSEIPANCCLRIYEYQQMYIYNELTINGELYNNGEIVLK